MTKLVRFTGTITLQSPVAVTIHGTTVKGEPTPVPETVVFDAATQALATTAFLPSTSLRGALRRSAVLDLYERRRDAGLPSCLDLRSYYMLAIGGTRSRGSSAQTIDAGAEGNVRKRNPLVSVFGAADTGDHYFLSAKAQIAHLLPASPLSPAACPSFKGVRIDDMLRRPDQTLAMMKQGAADDWHSLFARTRDTSSKKKEAKSLKTAAYKAKQGGDDAGRATINQQLREIDQSLESAEISVQMLIDGYRALPQGLQLNSSIVLRDPTDIEVGLFLAALQRFSHEPVLGGHRAHGCGQVSAQWSVSESQPRQAARTTGAVSIDGFGGFQADGDFAAAQAAWQDAAVSGDFTYAAREDHEAVA